MEITLTWLLILALAAGAIAVIDGVLRLRGRGGATAVGIIELIVGALFLLSLFIANVPFAPYLAVALAVTFVFAVIAGRGRTLPIVGLAVLAIWFILANRLIIIPGIN